MIGTYTISSEQDNFRLDAALAAFFPDLSLREVRRAWSKYLVKLNGKYARKGSMVKVGDVVDVCAVPEESVDIGAGQHLPCSEPVVCSNAEFTHAAPDLSQLCILKRSKGIAAIFKPAGLHTAKLPEGRGGLSLEDMLPELYAGVDGNVKSVELFNRLDCLTSGIVLSCEDLESMKFCLAAEKSGKIEKRYLALVHGRVYGDMLIKNRLDTDSRRKTRVLQEANTDSLRHTLARPLHFFESLPASFSYLLSESDFVGATLLDVTILCGARHQIRAHLASAGFPIVGDPLYGVSGIKCNQRLYLHHYAVSLPDFVCLAPAFWEPELLKVCLGLFPGL